MTAPAAARIEALAVGRPSRRWTIAVALLVLCFGWGVFAYSQEVSHGLVSSGLRSIGRGGATWGLYIVFAVYFIGLSFAGISAAALARLFSLEALRPVTRMAELLAIVSLLMGGLCILADLGRPLRGLLYLPLYARPASPFFGTFTLVISGYLFASLVYFFLSGRADAALCARELPRFRWLYRLWATGYQGRMDERRRHVRSSFWLSIFILPLLVTAHSTLGFVFGIHGGRPGWYSALQAPSFVILAGSSGTAMLILIAAAMRRALALPATIGDDTFRLLGNFLWILTLTYLYLMVVQELTASYASSEADARVAHETVYGTYAWMFWTTVACFAIPTLVLFLQFVRGRTHLGWTVVAALAVSVGSVLKRFLIVVPSQTHGMLLPYAPGRYVPSWIELSVVLGLFATSGILFLIFTKAFPIVPITPADGEETSEAVIEAPWERRAQILRGGIFWGILILGLGTAVTGFLLSLRLGTLPYQDPIVPYSPVLFAAGVMLTFFSSAAYELLPPPRRRLPGDD
ncbi:MAG: NrfD/PsrC family molybdoenzyme membrane anchor subunit [Myxococcota bacterium]